MCEQGKGILSPASKDVSLPASLLLPVFSAMGARVSAAQEGEGEDGEDEDGEQPRRDERRSRLLRNHAEHQADLRCGHDERE